ncbi:hypothetical protein BDW02DRAFT_512178 [Decorospora gaudefroyi]|uniref:Uncharacterized protein n=1 Tax=Decorospora gaudefroyi TaxID=184978 RepID=A0A6A5JX41_9PLEO|nr:hypothetical protein BDW02DRAFT_512178 [Decorospora gaudefroyi]
MARLASPATTTGLLPFNPVSKIPRPVPIQSVSSRSTSLARLASSRTISKAVSAASRTLPLAASSRTSLGARRPEITLLAKARADYEQIDGVRFRQTKVPGPTTRAVNKANARRHSEVLSRMVSVVRRRIQETDVVGPRFSSEAVGAGIFFEEEVQTTADAQEFEDVSDWETRGLSEDEDTSIMFNDRSFDEAMDPELQNPVFYVFERRIASGRRVGKGLRIATCPRYSGNGLGIARARPLPLPKMRTVRANQVHAHYHPAKAPATSKIPYLVWPLVKPASVGETKVTAIPISKVAPIVPKRAPSKAPKKTVARAAKPLPPVSKPTVKRAAPKQKLTAPGPRVEKSSVGKRAQKPTTSQAKTTKPGLQSALRQPKRQGTKKRLQFVEGPVKPRFFSRDDTVKQSAVNVDEAVAPFHWAPLSGLLHSQVASEGHGTMQLFESATLGTLTLKRRFLNRYASVQRYEKRRRQDAIIAGEQPGLGQLEYGNGSFKVELRATEAIMAHEIGIAQNLSTVGKAGKLLGGRHTMTHPVIVFGAFKEPFEPAVIPAKGVKAYKKPLRWPARGSEEQWKVFADKHLRCLQASDAED